MHSSIKRDRGVSAKIERQVDAWSVTRNARVTTLQSHLKDRFNGPFRFTAILALSSCILPPKLFQAVILGFMILLILPFLTALTVFESLFDLPYVSLTWSTSDRA